MYLVPEDKPEQMSIFDALNQKDKVEKAEKTMEELNQRFGTEIVKNASLIDVDSLPNSRRKIKYNEDK